jgi:ribonucleoside-triphosphate reductase
VAKAGSAVPAHALPFTSIRKRDGRMEAFNAVKITQALHKAGQATGEFALPQAQHLTTQVLALAHAQLPQTLPTVEALQDVVEAVLLASPYRQTAKAYILYRDQHARLRELTEASHVTLLDHYLTQHDWQVRENANMSYSLQGLNNYIASELTKTYWLNESYPPEVRQAHKSGALHLHDLNSLAVYCVGWDLMDLLKTGFRGVSGKVACTPAKHLSSALGQVVNFFYTLQGEAAGAQAFSNFDTLLAPFIYYDQLSEAEVWQALQAFIFNLNVPTRVGFQSPFTNLTFDLRPSPLYRDQPVIIGGVPQEKTYGEFAEEMALFNRLFCEVMQAGDADGRVFSFPIPTYNITEDFDWDNPNDDALWAMTAKYGVPYFANFIGSEMSPEDARSMCCRLRLDNRQLSRRGGGLFGANALTGSVGVVTLNLPRLGYLASSEADFMAQLAALMDTAKTSLELKRHLLEDMTAKGLYPYSAFYLKATHERFGQYWANHFSTVGLLGMNEACLNLLGEGIATPAGHAFALRVLTFMRERLGEYQEATGNLYNLEATPGEGTSYRFASIDKRLYPEILCANQAEVGNHGSWLAGLSKGAPAPFYSNSSQLPVDATTDPLEALAHQEALQACYTGGTVFHAFLGESPTDIEAVKGFVRSVCNSYQVPYLTLTPTFSICPQHGYLVGEHTHCPTCGGATEVYSRVVGYLRPVGQWNDAKQAEYITRTPYAMV